MMIDIPMKYEISFFADMSEVKASTAIITELLQEFEDKGFLPRFFQELPNQAARLGLVTPGGQWEIGIRSQRIVIVKSPIERDPTSMGTVADFCTEAVNMLSRILSHLPARKASRLALVTEELMPAMTEELLHAVYAKLFNPIPFYVENEPKEWVSRSVTQLHVEINDIGEELNVISIVSRVQGELMDPKGLLKFDRIQLGFDVNTFQGAKDTRFSVDNATEFFTTAIEVRQELMSELEGHLK